jgi:hypothetical protein
MEVLKRTYRLFNFLSFDVVVGSIVGSMFLAQYLRVAVSPFSMLVLAITVWLVYTADHLRDALASRGTPSHDRHRFHLRHQKLLKLLVVMLAMVNGVLLLFLSKDVLFAGVVVGTFVAIYLLLVPMLGPAKEACVAVLYVLGLLVPAGENLLYLSTHDFLVIVEFILLAFMNLLTFSLFDHEGDCRDDCLTLTSLIGKKYTLFLLTFVFLGISLLTFRYANDVYMPSLWFMGLIHAIMVVFPSYFKRYGRFRLVGDLVFVLPILIVTLR